MSGLRPSTWFNHVFDCASLEMPPLRDPLSLT